MLKPQVVIDRMPYIWYYVSVMASKKMTFTLDERTVARLARAAQRLGMPKSQVVREAIGEYSAKIGRLGKDEQARLLRSFDELVPRIPERPLDEVESEIEQVRETRRGGGRNRGMTGP